MLLTTDKETTSALDMRKPSSMAQIYLLWLMMIDAFYFKHNMSASTKSTTRAR